MSAMRLLLLVFAIGLGGLLAAHHEAGEKPAPTGTPKAAEYVRVYTGDDGESHFEKVKATLALDPAAAQPIGRSEVFSAGEFSLIGAPQKWDYTWHTAPRRQFVIVLQGVMEVEVAGGVVERFSAGDVLLADDTTGRGHQTRSVGDEPLLAGVVPIDAAP